MIMTNPVTTTFRQWLSTAFITGPWATDDVVAFILPLAEEVLSFHENGQVAPFEKPDTVFINNGRLDIDEQYAQAPLRNTPALQPLLAHEQLESFSITERLLVEEDVSEHRQDTRNADVQLNTGEPLTHPVYLPGYSCYEITIGHHDALTDIFCLGLVLGSVAMGLDLYDPGHLQQFVQYRRQAAGKNPRLHPTLCALVSEMTELHPQRRSRDLQEVIQRLKYYRDYDPQRQTDLAQLTATLQIKKPADRKEFILNKLRNRLFDTSRRNRLLYYKPNMRFVNLTVSSVPMVMHYQHIPPESLFTWNAALAPLITAGKSLSLNKYLRFEDHPYLDAQLNNIRLAADNDEKEYGFSQLKLVVAFLHWHNLKEDIQERIQTPLLLVPAKLTRSKALKEERFTLSFDDTTAVVNPVLANYLKELYGIVLPESIALDKTSMEDFFRVLKALIDEARQGVVLSYIDKPRIRLVHSIARQTINNYRKKLAARGATPFHQADYSYSEDNYKPLGLELFRRKVEPQQSSLEFLLGGTPPPGHSYRFSDTAHNSDTIDTPLTRQQSTFELTDGHSNPYSWDFDVCNIVLGNFNYKKMSLVSDYNTVAEQQIDSPVFNELFSTTPRRPFKEHGQYGPPEWYHVITADPTQTNAILHSRSGNSYIIQGPPGTGKSQTITNLVADFLAQGKSILFVCEKRAALDVVYHRLQQNKLSELCCYIHDSQGDKKEFVRDLKTVYEDFIANKMDLPQITRQRKAALDRLQRGIELLQHYHDTQTAVHEEAGITTRRLLETLVQLQPHATALTVEEQESLPGYRAWLSFGDTLNRLGKALEDTGADAALARHPFSHLGNPVIVSDQPFTLIASLEDQVQSAIRQLAALISKNNIPKQHVEQLRYIKNLVEDSVALESLAQSQNLQLVEKSNPEAQAFENLYRQYQQLLRDYQQAMQGTTHWQQKFSRTELSSAIGIAARKEKSFFRFLSGDWRRLNKQLKTAYDFSAHQLRPSCSSILQQLQQEYEAQDKATAYQEGLQEKYHVSNISHIYISIEVMRRRQGDAEVDYLLQHPHANELVIQLSKLNNVLQQLEIALRQLLHSYEHKSLSQLQDEIAGISANAESLKEVLPALRQFVQLPDALQAVMRNIPLSPQQAEAAMAHKTWGLVLQQNPLYAGTNGKTLHDTYGLIEKTYKELLQLNSDYIRATRRQRFLQSYDLSNAAAALLSPEQKQLKKDYLEGRRVLEHEMGKTRSYKSIREMASDESGKVLKDIKPVWLMSPLSVSDSLPIDTGFFDVVIYDEASQITLEEGIPALFRAPQTIIVGDDKQMPPSNFFTARADDPNDLENFEGEREDEILSTEADSLLVQGSRKLHSTMLSWHYRSRYETLISYSNHAFYEAGLLTIPDKTIHHHERPGIAVQQPEEGTQNARQLLHNSISFHYLPASVYEARSNTGEAKYIACMVRELLLQNIPESIGIVAFSQEQQGAIEDAINQLAEKDKAFDEALEKALNRKDEGQFTGLFIKNLENVQGDERDIIIMSVCYGHDARRRMLMNFGPINRKGGEKRLNVLFSRAKKHMAVVSSIKHQHITNDYNEGAAYFKRFLHYAEMVSTGQMRQARQILDSLVTKEATGARAQGDDGGAAPLQTTIAQIKEALEKAGYAVDEQIGQSSFKCTLGVKKKHDDPVYSLGLLVDDDSHYNNSNLVEQYYQRPAMLRAFGWKLLPVFAKDWLEDRPRVWASMLQALDTTGEAGTLSSPATAAAAPATSPAAGVTMLVSADGERFWEIKQEGHRLLLRFGKTGTRGQAEVKTLESEEQAAAQLKELVAARLESGYIAG